MKKLIQTTPLIKDLLGILTLALILSTPAIGGIYKWVDENGKTHYGSQRPENAPAEKMKLKVSQPASGPEQEEETGAVTKLTKPEKAQKERTSYCEGERKRLQTVMKNKDIHEKDSKGNVQQLSSKARTQRLNKIKANISKYCK